MKVIPGQLFHINDDYTCSLDPTNKKDRFDLAWFVENNDTLVLVITVVDFSDPNDPLYEQDDVWFLGLTSCGRFGWIPTGDLVKGGTYKKLA